MQVVRAFAFLGVFLSHSGITAFSAGGAWGVSVFFILSGFLMFYAYSDTDRIKECGIIYSIKFGINKIKKLYALHIVTMILALPWIVKACINHPEIKEILISIAKIIFNIFLLQSWIPSNEFYFSLNGVSWYLSTSLFLYVMFPFILYQMKKCKRMRTPIVAIMIIFTLQIIMFYASWCIQAEFSHRNEFVHWFTYICPLSRLGDFIIGCNLGFIFKNRMKKECFDRKMSTALEIGVTIMIIIQMAIYILTFTIPRMSNPSIISENWWGFTVLWTISSCVLIYLFASNTGILSNILTNKSVVFIGNMSANSFLIHQMIYKYLDLIEKNLFHDKYEYANVLMCFLITIASAYMWDFMVRSFRDKRSYNTVS